MRQFTLKDTLGAIVATYPGASDFFMDRQIDFCCGGERTLLAAMEEAGLTEKTLLEPLNQAYLSFQERREVFVDWANSHVSLLIEHILTAHHNYLREEMPSISALLFKLLGVHGANHPELFEIHLAYNTLRTELESHMVNEELWLFPAISDAANRENETHRRAVAKLLEKLEADHVGAGDLLKKLRSLTDHYTVPGDGCTTYALAMGKLKALEKNTFEHVHLENNILFPVFAGPSITAETI